MKKEYEVPKAEKMEFNYSEAVVASSVKCESGVTKKYKDTIPNPDYCSDTWLEDVPWYAQ